MSMRVGALDVGHGWIKGLAQDGDEASRFVYRSVVRKLQTGESYNKALQVVPITVRGHNFLIGPDAFRLVDHRYDTRLRTREYPSTPAYHAHCEAGVAFMGMPELNVLAAALPLSTIGDEAENLERFLRRTFYVPNPASRGSELMRVAVHDVIVISQPAAALLAAATDHPEVADGLTLMVDSGFHTTDYLLTHNLEPNQVHSGVIESAACEYLDRLALYAEDQFAKDHPFVRGGLGLPRHRFEDALAAGATVLKTPSGSVDLTGAIAWADQLLDDYWSEILSNQPPIQSIHHVVVAGAMASAFARVFHRRHPERPMPLIAAAPEPQFAVARGLLVAAVDHYLEKHESR